MGEGLSAPLGDSDLVQVIGDSGCPVDVAFSYKVPKLSGGLTGDSASGYEYAYWDPTLSQPVKSPYRIDQSKGWLHDTLAGVFQNSSSSVGYVCYNDEAPAQWGKPDNGNLGHTKGCLAFDLSDGSAWWLLHSWPKFPWPGLYQTAIPPSDYPTPIYGQTKLCLSVSIDTLGQIAAQMIDHQEPQVYATKYPVDLPLDNPLFLLGQNISPNAPGDSAVLSLTTAGGMPFKVIAKNRKWALDYWNDLVGPTLEVDLDVETWIRGDIAPTADAGGIHTTTDVKFIDAGPLGPHWVWPETADHSKFGVSVTGDWVIIADINRMVSQRNRGGGGIAFQNPCLWLALKRASLVMAPPGMSRTQAHAHIKTTHVKTAK